MASFVVIYDACVLHPAPLRDLLLRVATSGLVRARWTDQILDECFSSILRRRPDLDARALLRTRAAMCRAVPDCVVTGYQPLIEALELPDPSDRHVLAAAIRGGAQAIVTLNLKDFPDHLLAKWEVEPKHPDEFVFELIDLAPDVLVNCVLEQAAALRSPPMSVEELLVRLRDNGLIHTTARFAELLSARP